MAKPGSDDRRLWSGLMRVPVYDKKGKEVDAIDIDTDALGGEINPALIKQAYVRYHANCRQGSARSKSRGLVQGSTRKLFRQKGTGNARMGANRQPVRKGGGHAFAKTRGRESFRPDMPVKMRRRANRNALLAKLVDNEVRIVNDLEFSQPSTQAMLELLDAIKIDRSALVALHPGNVNARLSARNAPEVTTCANHELNCFNMLNNRYLVIAREPLEAWLSGPSSRTDKHARDGSKQEASA